MDLKPYCMWNILHNLCTERLYIVIRRHFFPPIKKCFVVNKHVHNDGVLVSCLHTKAFQLKTPWKDFFPSCPGFSSSSGKKLIKLPSPTLLRDVAVIVPQHLFWIPRAQNVYCSFCRDLFSSARWKTWPCSNLQGNMTSIHPNSCPPVNNRMG